LENSFSCRIPADATPAANSAGSIFLLDQGGRMIKNTQATATMLTFAVAVPLSPVAV
jgi:hypothetical protein